MLRQFLVGGGVSVVNIAIHALVMTIVVRVARTASMKKKSQPSLFLIAVMIPTVSVLMVAHALEVIVWSLAYSIVDAAPGGANLGAGAALIPSPFTHPSSVRAVMLRAHPRTLEDRTARPGPLALGDDEPADEVEGSDRALCCSPILFGLLALEVRFRPAGLALLRRELGVARTRVMLRKSRTRLRTRALRVSFLSWAAFRSIDLNGRGLRTSLARVRARIGRKIA